jgi:DNA repair protein RecO (recombination protein O)
MPGGASLFAGFYLNELLLKLLARQDPHPDLFDAYADTLAAMAEPSADTAEAVRQVALRAFELKLLRELGVLPELAVVTLAVAPVRPERRYTLDAEAGVLAAPGGETGLPGSACVALEAALQHGSGSALRLAVQPVVGALRGPLRGLLHYHLGSVTLRTRQVLWGMQKLIEPGAIPAILS